MLERVRLLDSAARIAGLLSHGQKQWLEIGMLLVQDPKVMLIDEPVAGMTREESAAMAGAIAAARAIDPGVRADPAAVAG
jgi:urea transport system ATP-binding protein